MIKDNRLYHFYLIFSIWYGLVREDIFFTTVHALTADAPCHTSQAPCSVPHQHANKSHSKWLCILFSGTTNFSRSYFLSTYAGASDEDWPSWYDRLHSALLAAELYSIWTTGRASAVERFYLACPAGFGTGAGSVNIFTPEPINAYVRAYDRVIVTFYSFPNLSYGIFPSSSVWTRALQLRAGLEDKNLI
jgi:hypothetical protein